MLAKKRNHEGAQVVETRLQVGATYEPAERITLGDEQEAARLGPIEDQCDDDNGYSAGLDENQDEPAEYMACYFHDLQSRDRRGFPAFQAVWYLCTKYSVNEPDTLVSAQGIIEDEISSISRLLKLTYQLTEAKKT